MKRDRTVDVFQYIRYKALLGVQRSMSVFDRFMSLTERLEPFLFLKTILKRLETFM